MRQWRKSFSWREIPFLYRTHEAPDEDRIRQLSAFVNSFGYHIHVGNEIRPKEIQKLLEKVEGKPEEDLISRLTLRSMKQARYTTENTGHFGLSTGHGNSARDMLIPSRTMIADGCGSAFACGKRADCLCD